MFISTISALLFEMNMNELNANASHTHTSYSKAGEEKFTSCLVEVIVITIMMMTTMTMW